MPSFFWLLNVAPPSSLVKRPPSPPNSRIGLPLMVAIAAA